MDRYELISRYLVAFLRDEVHKTGLKKVVVGLSGGLDSAVVALLAHRAFGDNLLCIKMPSDYSSQSSLDDADALCLTHGLRSETHSIQNALHSFDLGDKTPLRIGNISARLRMVTLFDISARENALVLGTSNKSELMLGYGTLYGDLASALNPIGDLYKTEVFELAHHLGVNNSIIAKPPSADLWEGQCDEVEIGYSYYNLDRVLKLYVESRLTREELLERGEESALVDLIIHKIYQNQFKRTMPVVAKLTSRTLNHDFNYPRDITQ